MDVLIAGGGKVGSYLASFLLAGGHRVKVIEVRREQVEQLHRDLDQRVEIVLGSGSDPEVLELAGIRRMNVVAAVTGADEINLVITSLARFEFNVRRTIARVNNPKNAWMFTADMGVDVALNQADLMGHMIAEEMSLGDMMTLLKLRRGQFSLVEEKVAPNALVVGKSVGELNLPAGCVFAAILRKDQLIIPQADVVLQPADEILAVLQTSQVQHLADLLGPKNAP
ncbi:MAG: TrkA family potassium uptake protein [Chloroflexi bacterium]|nr:TrkA family potassium uptake protein [Chloroflexota bacterium]